MGEWLKLGTSAGAVDLQLVSDWKPRGLWSAESSFKSALLQQHMSVLQYLHCLAAHRAVASSLHPAWYLAMTRRRRNVSCPCRKPDSAARGRSALRCGRWVMVNASEAILILVQVEMLPAQVLLERHWDAILWPKSQHQA